MTDPPHRLRHVTAAPMSESNDPISEIVASRREVVAEDVEPLWSDLMSGRKSPKETARRAQLLMETVNATHVANWGLSSLYALTFRGMRGAEDVSVAHEQWRRHVTEYQADPEAWDRRYYQRMIVDFAQRHGTERAKALGDTLVASGELRAADVAAVLPDPAVE